MLIQVKGGSAARPTLADCERLRIVAQHHRASGVLLAVWKKGTEAQFFTLRSPERDTADNWVLVPDPSELFQ